MKVRPISIYTISIFWITILASTSVWAQNDSISATPQTTDSLKIKQKYGLRVGADLSKIIRSFLDDNYSGFEIMGDFRLTQKWYVAGEFGIEEKTTEEDYLNATTKGTYFKVGADYNAYENWFGMENMIYGGFRLAGSSFSQTLNSFSIYNNTQYWTPQFSTNESVDYSGLTALWGEFIAGIKVEVLNNLYLGANMQFKYMITQDEPDNFQNLYVPGFNKTFDSSNFGFGFGYNITYLIPIFKKDK